MGAFNSTEATTTSTCPPSDAGEAPPVESPQLHVMADGDAGLPSPAGDEDLRDTPDESKAAAKEMAETVPQSLKELPNDAVPKLIVFDLDDTLWHPEMHTMKGPFIKNTVTGQVTSTCGAVVKLARGVEHIIKELKSDSRFRDTKIAYASRTVVPHQAKQCMELMTVGEFPLSKFCHYAEVYPGNKKLHFQKLKEASGIDFGDMLFFDNEEHNCVSVSELGVVCMCVPGGITAMHWKAGLEKFARAKHAPGAAVTE